MAIDIVLPTRRRRPRSLFLSQSLLLLCPCTFAYLQTSSSFGSVCHYAAPRVRHTRDSAGASSDVGDWPARLSPTMSPLRASVSEELIEVKRTTRNPVDTTQLANCGSTFYASGYDDGNKDGWVLMQTISGVAADGREVIAVVAPGKYSAGSSVKVEARYLLDKPAILDWDRAAMLPFLAVNCLCPLLDAGFSDTTARGQTFVVTGGHGSLSPFVVQVLNAWGGRVCCVTTRNQGAVQTLGARLAVDFRKASYSDAVQEDIAAVIDTLGRENEGAQRMLKEAKGAEYISLQPKVLKVAVEEGVLFGAGKILQYQQTIAKDDARTYFLPNVEAMTMVSQIAGMIASKSVELGVVGTDYVGMQEYMEALAWPKDSETGLRYGFPGKTNRSWGWLGGQYDDEDGLPWEEDEDEEEDEEEEDEKEERERAEGENGKGQGAETAGPVVPTGEVVRVKSREELRALTEEGGTIVFVSSRSCRACKFLTPFYRKLAQRQQQVWFGRVDASSHPELARDLGLKAVPSFVTFRGGEQVTATSTSNKKKIEGLVEELLYD